MLLGMRNGAIAALLVSLAACSARVEENYATWADAQRGGAIGRGWIPPFVPSSARDIRDIHDLDTNAQTLTFTVPPSNVQKMVAGLHPISAEDQKRAAKLAEELGFAGAPAELEQAYVVCSRRWNSTWNGMLLVDRQSGRAVYKTPAEWADDDCSRAN